MINQPRYFFGQLERHALLKIRRVLVILCRADSSCDVDDYERNHGLFENDDLLYDHGYDYVPSHHNPSHQLHV